MARFVTTYRNENDDLQKAVKKLHLTSEEHTALVQRSIELWREEDLKHDIEGLELLISFAEAHSQPNKASALAMDTYISNLFSFMHRHMRDLPLSLIALSFTQIHRLERPKIDKYMRKVQDVI